MVRMNKPGLRKVKSLVQSCGVNFIRKRGAIELEDDQALVNWVTGGGALRARRIGPFSLLVLLAALCCSTWWLYGGPISDSSLSPSLKKSPLLEDTLNFYSRHEKRGKCGKKSHIVMTVTLRWQDWVHITFCSPHAAKLSTLDVRNGASPRS